jgi:hypothetical protein
MDVRPQRISLAVDDGNRRADRARVNFLPIPSLSKSSNGEGRHSTPSNANSTSGFEDWRDWVMHVNDDQGDELFVVPFTFVIGKAHCPRDASGTG